MSAKHTPGPWKVLHYYLSDEDLALCKKLGREPIEALTNDGARAVMGGTGDDRRRLALVDCLTPYKRGKGHETKCATRDANAALIAAAPDLLVALQALVGCIMETRGTEAQSALTLAHRAIAKATGGQ